MTEYNQSGKFVFKAAAAGTYAITAAGAQGGAGSTNNGGGGGGGGLGATASGDIYLAKGAKLEIVVGGEGGVGGSSDGNGGGGGGGSFVIEMYDGTSNVNVKEVIAGGGGGGSYATGHTGGGGVTNGSGSAGRGGASGGGGGGGFTGGSGGDSGSAGGPGSNNAKTFAGGPGASGTYGPYSITGGAGGLGGGGGGGLSGGGGGGGYGGGNGGMGNTAGGNYSGGVGGGGGGSYVNPDATHAAQTAGNHTGDGFVDIALLCFAAGTLIATERGDIAVERLAVGDRVVTASGALRPIRWLGHRTIACAAQTRPSESWPVRIRAGAFGAHLPARDLYLSPGHPVLVGAENDEGGVLVPVMCLINGTTIERAPRDEVTYWHVELDAHDILLAENLPAESYIDLGSRPWFAGADGALYDPDMAAPGMPGRCRPVAIDGPVVEAERRRLDGVFATSLAAACAWPDATAALAAM